jgi:hypothetical protein
MIKKCMCVAICLAAGMSISVVYAKPPVNVAEVPVSLDSPLASLKQSVARLSLENEEVASLNGALRAQIKNAEQELGVLQREDARIREQYQAVESTYKQKRDALQILEQRLLQLDQVSSDLAREADRILEVVRVREEEEAKMTMEVQVRTAQLVEMRQHVAEPVSRSSLTDTIDQHKLARDLAATEASLLRTREEWLALQRLIEGGTGQLDLLKKENAALRVRIQAATEALANTEASLSNQRVSLERMSSWSQDNPDAVLALEREARGIADEVASLQRELARLEKERVEKGRKVSSTKESEMKRLKASYDELKEKNLSLREELKKLRESMVTMDKKKAGIEKQLYRSSTGR